MIERMERIFKNWRRKRRLARFRHEFAGSGYPLDHLDDSQIEIILTGGKCRIEEVPHAAKTLYFALRRLPAINGENHFQPEKSKPAA